VTLSLAKNFAANLQSYEKTREMQKERLLFFSFTSASNFGKAKKNGSSFQTTWFPQLAEEAFCQENFEFWAVFWAF